ncbi:MAG TPA: GNAT family N-acetyltransferase [Bacteroidia bacterium]|nr:GNAT family N-acetyltransferase [Bacteroidia bacterium]
MAERKLIGRHTLIEEVKVEDAQHIIDLRNQPEINRFLSSHEKISLDAQQNWIKANLQKKDNVYFRITDTHTGEFCGTIAVYNIRNAEGEFGRYICTKTVQAIESELLLLRYCFNVLQLQRVYCRTIAANNKVWMQHYKFGFRDCGEETTADGHDLLKIQELKLEDFRTFDYSPLERVINRFNPR